MVGFYFFYLVFPGMLHDHPHYTGTRIFLCQLRKQRCRVQLLRSNFACHWYFSTWQICNHDFRKQGKAGKILTKYYQWAQHIIFRHLRLILLRVNWTMLHHLANGNVVTSNIVASNHTIWRTPITANSQAEGYRLCLQSRLKLIIPFHHRLLLLNPFLPVRFLLPHFHSIFPLTLIFVRHRVPLLPPPPLHPINTFCTTTKRLYSNAIPLCKTVTLSFI